MKSRRLRAALAWGLAAFLASNLWLAHAVETGHPEWRAPEFYHRQQQAEKFARRERRAGRDRPLVLVLGSSRPQMGFAPEFLGLGDGPTDPLVVNCAQSGCRPVGTRLNLARLLREGPKPDFALVEVLPVLLSDEAPADATVWPRQVSHADLATLAPYLEDERRYRREWFKLRATTISSLRATLVPHWLGQGFVADALRTDFLWSEMRPSGWSPYYPTPWPKDYHAAKLEAARLDYAPRLARFSVKPVPDRATRETLAACRAHGVRAAVFVMPESPAFRSWYPPAVKAEVDDYLNCLAREFGVPLFDTRDWVGEEMAYMDGHHLLGKTAERYAARFGRECLGPWVRGRE